MKLYIMPFLVLILTVSMFVSTVWGAHQLEYSIEIYADGSARWIIEHRFAKGEDEALFRQLSDPTYFSETFVKNIKSLLNATKYKTGRMNMTAETFIMTVNVLGSYSVVKYQFLWRDFAKTEDALIRIGDVFEVEGLFLDGDGTVNVIYPTRYAIESVSPMPNVALGQTITWYGIRDFAVGEPKIVLVEKTPFSFIDVIKENALIIGVLITLASGLSISFYYFKLRKKEVKEIVVAEAPVPPKVPRIDDEEKVVNLLRAAGGGLYQSTIADQCGFSRSKTSKLLAIMESKGKIRREEKGREKVVTLINKVNEYEKTKRRNSH